ncbi:proton-conducting transporter membrane subunit [Ahrensia sp. R2A130]|uniref:proton-conducting transporter transmembrane domain-containing protein n=1 Tax=Ahrensia sp. R2A130 TaxID=744979 RepID=UPI0001E0E0CB|nr:proton-conducting transporter membrane subunit [Ahrensia sp. R2A130]EFL88931.1 sodium/proton antiporter ShaA [Ahrensia sp. R2A130]
MSPNTLMILSLVIPLAASIMCLLLKNQHNLRDGLTFAATLALFATVLSMAFALEDGAKFSLNLVDFAPGISFAFEIERLGLMFALVASSLWVLTHIYGVGYMRGNNEKHHARFFACFAFAIFAALGIAYSANLLTLFLFYELLTVSTYPLVAHKGTPEAIRGARIYLGILMGTSIFFLLPAIVWTWSITGTMQFTPGGVFNGQISPLFMGILLGLYAFGIGKAALMPFHAWLPAAMVAPTPVSALLHAVAVVKAGVFSILKVGIYIFGIDNLYSTGSSEWLVWVAAGTIIIASLIAMAQDNLKKRLAYSTVSQLSYITLGVALATTTGALDGALHIVTHAFGKITLFMCAGAIYVATHKTEISDMNGLGRKMPFTYLAFGIGALSIIGLPPLAGSWSKWLLLITAAETNHQIVVGVLILSSLLNVVYLLPIFARGFYGGGVVQDGVPWRERIQEAPLFCVVPPCITAVCCLLIFFYAGTIEEFLIPITNVPGQ